jgi:creatinine amidohydrolase/Fe(II)-dependent formamide hydrolase-like protein
MLNSNAALSLAVLASLLTPSAAAQTAPASRPGAAPSAASPDREMARPIDAADSVFIEDLTWLEVRDAMRAGKRTVIVATGGIEQNGPYLVTGKHNLILRGTTEAIARKLGNALVAPIIAFVPEGEIDPPTSHMRYPGSISLRAATYKALLIDVIASMRAHEFEHVVLIGDSGGNQAGMKEVAAELNQKWAGGKTRVHFIPEYYDYPAVQKWIKSQGIDEVDEGLHDEYSISTMMMAVDPTSVRLKQRVAKHKASINGVSLLPAEKAIAFGKRVIEWRAGVTVEAIKRALSQ